MSESRHTTDVSNLIYLNSHYLDQAADLIESVSDDVYRYTDNKVVYSGIGEHFRHIIEHYQLFIDGMAEPSEEVTNNPSVCVDYDARKRDVRLSSDPNFAMFTIRELQSQIASIPAQDRMIDIKMRSSALEELNSPFSRSSLNRELQFLQSHTIHHFALIALILRVQHIEVSPEFGIAPSTLKFRQKQQSESTTD